MTKRMTKSDWEKFAKMLGGEVRTPPTGQYVEIGWKVYEGCWDVAHFNTNMARQIMKAIGER